MDVLKNEALTDAERSKAALQQVETQLREGVVACLLKAGFTVSDTEGALESLISRMEEAWKEIREKIRENEITQKELQEKCLKRERAETELEQAQ